MSLLDGFVQRWDWAAHSGFQLSGIRAMTQRPQFDVPPVLRRTSQGSIDQRVLEVSEDVIFKWSLLVEDGRKVGHTFSQPDLIIAATAPTTG